MTKHTLTLLLLCLTLPLQGVSKTSDLALTAHEQRARDLLATVIAMDTSVTEKRTPQMADYLATLFLEAGFAADDVVKVPIADSITALMVRYPGEDSDQPGVGFLAHMDVVTALRKDWELEPFQLTERNGYLIGRGTADNKTGVTGLTSTFLKLKEEGYKPKRTMVLMLTADEETGMLSARHFANNMAAEINIEYAINADALSGVLKPDGSVFGYYVQGAEKSYQSVQLIVRNPGGHSSAPRADNAIYQLADALKKVQAYQFPVMVNPISAGMLEGAKKQMDRRTRKAIDRLLANQSDAKAAAVVSANPLLATVIRTTCVATMLEAGHAGNALPQSASATVNCRIMPGMSTEEVYAALEKQIDDDEVEIKLLRQGVSAPASDMRPDVMAAIQYALGDSYKGLELTPFMASYGTDGREFRLAGIDVYGSSGFFMDPGEAYAHGLNEKILAKAFYESLAYWERLMKRLSGG